MRTLYLLRHAKSSWTDERLPDHDRPLDRRGERAATLVGVYFGQRGVRPSLVLCSSARRTRETLDRLLPHLDPAPEVRVDRELYLAGPGELLARIAEAPDEVEELLLLGHNPGIAELAFRLAGSGDRDARQRLAHKYPTGACAELRFGARCWRDLASGGGELVHFVTPKELV